MMMPQWLSEFYATSMMDGSFGPNPFMGASYVGIQPQSCTCTQCGFADESGANPCERRLHAACAGFQQPDWCQAPDSLSELTAMPLRAELAPLASAGPNVA